MAKPLSCRITSPSKRFRAERWGHPVMCMHVHTRVYRCMYVYLCMCHLCICLGVLLYLCVPVQESHTTVDKTTQF